MSTIQESIQEKRFENIQRLEQEHEKALGESGLEQWEIRRELNRLKRELAEYEEQNEPYLRTALMKSVHNVVDYSEEGKVLHTAAKEVAAKTAEEKETKTTAQKEAAAIHTGDIEALTTFDINKKTDAALEKYDKELEGVLDEKKIAEIKAKIAIVKSPDFFTKNSDDFTEEEIAIETELGEEIMSFKEREDYSKEAQRKDSFDELEETEELEPGEDKVVRPRDESFIGQTRSRADAGAPRRVQEVPKGFTATEEDIRKIYTDQGLEISDTKLNEFMETAKDPHWQDKSKEAFMKQVGATVEKGVEEKTTMAMEALPTGDVETGKEVVKEAVKTQVEPDLLAGNLLMARGKEQMEKGWSADVRTKYIDEEGVEREEMRTLKPEELGMAEAVRHFGKGSAQDVYAYNLRAKEEGREDWRKAYALDILGTTGEPKPVPKKEALNRSDQEFFYTKDGIKAYYKDTFVNKTTGKRTWKGGEAVYATDPTAPDAGKVSQAMGEDYKSKAPKVPVDTLKIKRDKLKADRARANKVKATKASTLPLPTPKSSSSNLKNCMYTKPKLKVREKGPTTLEKPKIITASKIKRPKKPAISLL